MDKVLTISVAAYNVSAYIRENLDSILNSEVRDKIEVLVVDDGGKDNTLDIAQEYEKKYPGIVYAVHKENGGYGSVQNYSIAHAKGKYFKILDGDDWMDTQGLTQLVHYLSTSNVDAVATHYGKGSDRNSLKVLRVNGQCPFNTPVDPNILSFPVGMWALTFKTDILRQSKLILPEHTLYTDRIFATMPFGYVKTIVMLDLCVYCYRTNREGQSVSRESRIKHIEEYLNVTEAVCRGYAECENSNKSYYLLKAAYVYKVTIRSLLLLPDQKVIKERIKSYEKKIKSISPVVYKKSASLKTRMGCIIRFLRMTHYNGVVILSKVSKDTIDF